MTTTSVGTWYELGANTLPNAPVYDMVYDSVDDLLVVGTLGRGAWTYDALSAILLADLDRSGQVGCGDVDALVQQIVNLSHAPSFDLNGDGAVTIADLDSWRVHAGKSLFASGNPVLPGDANLDGAVDLLDFQIWNLNQFTNQAAWCQGDFSADGAIEGSDFGIWNTFKFMSSESGSTLVPEPATGWIVLALVCLFRRVTCFPGLSD
jgi:hypothetical protein